MPHDLVAWCLHSRRRLAAVLAAVVALGGAVLVLLPDDTPVASTTPRQPMPAEAAPVARADPPPSRPAKSTHGEPPPAWSEVRAAAQAFLNSYLVGSETSDRLRFSHALKDLVTPTLWRGLRLADPASYPIGVVDTVEPIALGAFGAQVRAVLDDGSAMELTLVEYGGGWRVADVLPREVLP